MTQLEVILYIYKKKNIKKSKKLWLTAKRIKLNTTKSLALHQHPGIYKIEVIVHKFICLLMWCFCL